MNSRDTRTEQLLAELWEMNPGRDRTGARISRRKLLRSSAGTAVVSVVGISGLLELLSNREAMAAGMVIAIVGVTREPNEPPEEETPHRHTFSVRFQVTDVSPTAVSGNVAGRTEAVIPTGIAAGFGREDQHFHLIQMPGVVLDAVIPSGPENNLVGEHMHLLSIE